TIEALIAEYRPALVGLSVMTFQRRTARQIISLIRTLAPGVRIVVGGYDPSLAPDAWTDPDIGVDFIVRGEGEATFCALVRALEGATPMAAIAGLWYREGETFRRNGARPIAAIERGEIRLPQRGARVLAGYTMLARQVDV